MLGATSLSLNYANITEGLSDTLYARTAKELHDFIKSIRAEGAQSDLNLPRVVVVGNQSAGKSSLVEAISEIKVPRDAGTCTRCPMELRLSSSAPDEPWSCQVFIRWEPSALDGRPAGEVPFGKPLTSETQDDIELVLRRAQAAVLNPQIGFEHVLTRTPEELSSLMTQAPYRFSKNVVCVDISGPDLPDLSFVDLPGLIQNDEGKGEVPLVESLVRSYISSSNTLIMLTLPMTGQNMHLQQIIPIWRPSNAPVDDIQNQKAAQLAREVDPHGLRTIGVLTKPDALLDGSLGQKETYLNIVEGRAHQTKHGYFIVRLPDDAERRDGITHSDARVAEAKFFAERRPWATSSHRHRFGVKNLVKSVSEPLTELIRADLPRVHQEVSAQRAACIKQLAELPPQTSEPQSHVYRLISLFVEEVRKVVEGSPSTPELVQSNKRSYTKLAQAIRESAPPFVPYVTQEKAVQLDMFVSPHARAKTTLIHLDSVRERIQACLTRELPNNIPYSVKRAFIQDFQTRWESDVMDCLDEVESTFKRILMNIVRVHFSRFKTLERAVRTIVLDLVDVHAVTAKQQQKFLLKYESNPPATQNTSDLAKLRAKWLEQYKEARAQASASNTDNSATSAPVPSLSQPAQVSQPQDHIPFSFAVPPLERSSTIFNPFMPTASGGLFGVSTPRPSSGPAPARLPSRRKPNAAADAATKQTPAKTTTQSEQPSSPQIVPFWERVASAQTQAPALATTPAATSATAPATAPPAPAPVPMPQVMFGVSDMKQTPAPASTPAPAPTMTPSPAPPLLAPLGSTTTVANAAIPANAPSSSAPDAYEDELGLMAEVRAYFDISCKRFVDYVPQAIDEHLLYAFAEGLLDALVERLGLAAEDAGARCARYVAEDPDVAARREALLAKKARLDRVHKELYTFGL
ncbi:P-loop containing nucleoside triphosphate hydrolase protein [Cubamyces lactineus]|nr:P-loop containing nucleoside triphosphate hydrolase protein [Cubamyces lactineus]